MTEDTTELTPDAWTRVDRYLTDALVGDQPALEAAITAQSAAGLPAIEVAPLNGKFLHLLARIAGARRVLEIGTLGGYSTIWLARALPQDGRVVTIEAEADNAAIARSSLERAGVAERVEVRIGRAAEILPTLAGEEAFDFVFIDADKPNNVAYLKAALALARPGALIIVDNVVREGRVTDASSTDAAILGTRALFDVVAAEPRLTATAIQTVGAKGWDGFMIAVVNDE